MFVQLTKAFLGEPAGERIDVSEEDAKSLVESRDCTTPVASAPLPCLVLRDAETLRDIRALQVLEQIAATGTDRLQLSAIDLLKNLAAGAPEARLTQEAKATVERVVKRATAKP